MNSLKQFVELANSLLKEADLGREYTIKYVVERLDDALNLYPSDPVIRSFAQVINKQMNKGKLITSQKELYDVYNHFAGINPNSMIKEAIGDILYPVENTLQSTISNETNYSFRSNQELLDLKVENNALDGVFDKNASEHTYYKPGLAKLGKYAIVEELSNIGVPANSITPISGTSDDKAIVYDVLFTNKLGTAHIPVFVNIKNNGHQSNAESPTHFYNSGKFVELNAENLNRAIVEKATLQDDSSVISNGGVVISSANVSAAPSIVVDKVTLPDTLKDLASFENAINDASTGFPIELVRTAKALCFRELKDMGFKAQVFLSEATDNCIICSAQLDSSVGKVEIKLPVEIINNSPQIPSLFYNEASKDKIYDFSKNDLAHYLMAIKNDNGQIMRYSNDFYNMSFHQLKDEMIAGVANKEYLRSEAALNRIEDKFPAQHLSALSDYAKYLKHASNSVETSKNNCRLLITANSLEPRCGHYNVPVSRVSTNEDGNCELIDRKAKYENLANSSGAMMRTNKIVLT